MILEEGLELKGRVKGWCALQLCRRLQPRGCLSWRLGFPCCVRGLLPGLSSINLSNPFLIYARFWHLGGFLWWWVPQLGYAVYAHVRALCSKIDAVLYRNTLNYFQVCLYCNFCPALARLQHFNRTNTMEDAQPREVTRPQCVLLSWGWFLNCSQMFVKQPVWLLGGSWRRRLGCAL